MKIRKFNLKFNRFMGADKLINTIVSLFIGGLVASSRTDGVVSKRLFFISLIISAIIIWSLMLIITSSKQEQSKQLSLELSKFLKNQQGAYDIILKECPYLTIDSYITLYHYQNDLENYLATAEVINIQSNKLIRARIVDIKVVEEQIELIETNNIDFLKEIVAKPIITKRVLSVFI